MDRLRYESTEALGAQATSLRETATLLLPPKLAEKDREEHGAKERWHGVPLTRSVISAFESYAVAGGFAALLAFVAGALAHSAVVDGEPICHPLAAVAIIASVATIVGMRIRVLSVMEEACITDGQAEAEARDRARRVLRSLAPGRIRAHTPRDAS
jgi:hypothetical protein